MFDQSFSAKNFYNILLIENRKGRNLEKKFFEQEIFIKYTLRIRDINKNLKKNLITFINQDPRLRKPSEKTYEKYKSLLRENKKKLKKEKEERLLVLLNNVSKTIQQPYFKFSIATKLFNGKKIYTVDDNVETYFAMKQLQYNFYKLYGVKQANRYEIVNQVKNLLNDRFPKFIIKTDIKGFYENIPNSEIIEKLNADNLLSPTSKKFIKQILRDYEKLAIVQKGKGIPRGIGISAYLAEYYMRRIDKYIIDLDDVVYYARYVDDILIIFIPKYSNTTNNYFEIVKEIVETKYHLTLNNKKTDRINLVNNDNTIQINGEGKPSPQRLNYLGYSFELLNNSKKQNIPNIEIYLTPNKINRYKTKIKNSFDIYKRYKDKNKAYRHLKNRIKFLTGNTRLINNKSNVLVGIYFSNTLLTKPDTLKELDKYLIWYINRYVKKIAHKKVLLNYSFFKGFTEKENKFYKFDKYQLKQIVEIWN